MKGSEGIRAARIAPQLLALDEHMSDDSQPNPKDCLDVLIMTRYETAGHLSTVDPAIKSTGTDPIC